jgi:ribosome biogenesis SPOUT family RNA methylase Rps3
LLDFFELRVTILTKVFTHQRKEKIMKKIHMFIGGASVVAMLVFSGCDLFKKKSEEEVIKEKQIELFKTTNINATVKNVKKENGKMMITVEIAGKEYQYEMEPTIMFICFQ